ncbi:MAG TPA: PPC domain-containing protein [Allocoleopsis sp.]
MFKKIFDLILILPVICVINFNCLALNAQIRNRLYNPIPIDIKNNKISIEDTLSEKDIPIGDGAFARDYVVNLKSGQKVVIDLISDNFDPLVKLMTPKGATLGENDDAADGSSNSTLFYRITKSGDYIIRVRGFGEAAGGNFTIKITTLYEQNQCPVN